MANLENALQIETKLEKEKTKVKIMKEHLEQYNSLTKNLSNILSTFEYRLAKMETTILPLYQKTKTLETQKHNLDTTLICLESVLSHYSSSQEVCSIIHQGERTRAALNWKRDKTIIIIQTLILGPNDLPIEMFLAALDKLKKADDYFRNNNSNSVELENVVIIVENISRNLD